MNTSLIYPENFINTIIVGDNMASLPGIPDCSVDLIVTDPPYGLTSGKNPKGGFMGKAWDKAVPSVELWKECLRVLKPGAFAFVMCIPRQDCLARMIVNLEDAGFNVSFSSLYHVFATGFPKSGNVSRLLDKRAGVEREVVGHRKERGMERQNAINAKHGYRSNAYQKDSDFLPITVPATPEAKAFDGAFCGLQLKPSLEVVLCVMRPLSEKTYIDQALRNLSEKKCVLCGYDERTVGNETHRLDCGCYMCDECLISGEAIDHEHKPHRSGSGCTWLDDGRIPTGENLNGGAYAKDGTDRYDGYENWRFKRQGGAGEYIQPRGRFPANLLVSNDVLNDGRERKTGEFRGALRANRGGFSGPMSEYATSYSAADSGSFSRYFDLDAWAIKNLPESARRTFPFCIVPKASKRERNAGLDEIPLKTTAINRPHRDKGKTKNGKRRITNRNIHATVKPIKLMSWLITIGSRPGDWVVDPFCGSGTTCIASAILGRRYTGMELDAQMCDISERRIKWHVEQKAEEVARQPDLPFGKGGEDG